MLFVEPGPSSITKGVEGSENEDGAFDFVWDDLLIDEGNGGLAIGNFIGIQYIMQVYSHMKSHGLGLGQARPSLSHSSWPGPMVWQAPATLSQAKAPALRPSRAMSITTHRHRRRQNGTAVSGMTTSSGVVHCDT